MTNLLNPLDLQTQAYLVEKGVRLIAQVGHFLDLTKEDFTELYTEVQEAAHGSSRCLPFYTGEIGGPIIFGFARYRWAADMYEWLHSDEAGALPPFIYHAILGMMYGYSGSEIREYLDRIRGSHV
jgi:hypothetical protein